MFLHYPIVGDSCILFIECTSNFGGRRGGGGGGGGGAHGIWV